ncbi:MAG: hypothetical protein EBU88_17870 [Acidobacteria bacterium]|nr:hypothetical protein [Acidobacteriota bacterium]
MSTNYRFIRRLSADYADYPQITQIAQIAQIIRRLRRLRRLYADYPQIAQIKSALPDGADQFLGTKLVLIGVIDGSPP